MNSKSENSLIRYLDVSMIDRYFIILIASESCDSQLYQVEKLGQFWALIASIPKWIHKCVPSIARTAYPLFTPAFCNLVEILHLGVSFH